MSAVADKRRILHGRHEVDADGDPTIHDEEGMRHFYDAWGRWMDRWPGDPELSFEEGQKREAA